MFAMRSVTTVQVGHEWDALEYRQFQAVRQNEDGEPEVYFVDLDGS